MSAILDHIVINARFEMDRVQDLFTGLGFTLTPRGHHTMGSHNHLMLFRSAYLEVVGIAEVDAHKRPEIANSPIGLNALVFKTHDADKTFARLEELGMAGEAPKSFSRPVTLSDGSTHDARFRTVTARDEAFPAARLYFCEHLTSDLVWRPEWQVHPNGVTGFSELVIVTSRPEEHVACLAELLEAQPRTSRGGGQVLALDDGFQLSFITGDDYAGRFGDLARPGDGREAFPGALGLRCGSIDNVRKFTGDTAALSVVESDGRLSLTVDAFDTLVSIDAES
ncbi:MAG: VOC family protein [Hyphomicrobiaceae bacterium]|nr:VOC family protein [Hyphomicrobiaceae bacterium]